MALSGRDVFEGSTGSEDFQPDKYLAADWAEQVDTGLSAAAALQTLVDGLASDVEAIEVASGLGFPPYDDTAAGLAGTATGETFSVQDGNYLRLYVNDDGAADELGKVLLAGQLDEMVQDAPPVLVDADPDGFARFVLRADGSMDSTVGIIHGGNDVSVPGLRFAETDRAGLATRAQRSDGSFIEVDPAPPPGVAGNVHLLLVDGQSPFVASATTAASTTPVAGLKMFNAGARPSTSDFDNAASAFTSFVDHVESGNETSARGMAEGVVAAASAEGRPIVSAGSEIVSCVTAVGSQSVRALSPGGDYWHHKTAAVDRWAAICAGADQVPGQVFWGIWQGEDDTAIAIGGAAWAAKWEAARLALEDYIETVLGWRVPVVQVHMQTAAHNYYNRPLPLIGEAANRATQYPRIFGALPTYDFDYGGADGVGSHMSTAEDAFKAGWRCGYAVGQCWAGVRPARIIPASATRAGARVIRITYGGGYSAPLEFSTAVVADPGDFGFEVGTYDSAGDFTALSLDDVRVVGGEAVVLTATADLPSTPLVIRYGYIGGALDDGDPDAFGSYAGRVTGPRGCLQSDPGTSFDFNGTSVDHILRPAIHSIITE